jgi:DUF218 domain
MKRWPRLVQRRNLWCPTWLGMCCAIGLLVAPFIWWFFCGERFLCLTERLPAKVLVVEGWIGRDGMSAARNEFMGHGYDYIVAAGGLTSGRWGEEEPSSFADMAGAELIRLGIPKDRVILAPAKKTETRRTFESAAAVRPSLLARGIHPKVLNVFTLGPHARRSQSVFGKALSPEIEVGVIAWIPPDFEERPWWRSSERSREFLEETAGYLFEVLLNSGRKPMFLGP